MHAYTYRLAVLCLMIHPLFTFAQTAPDTGQVLRELTPKLVPLPSHELAITGPAPERAQPSGEVMALKALTFSGNKTLDDVTLKSQLITAVGKSYDLAGLKGLANQITAYYASRNYPFARAMIPAQDLSEGNLKIEIIEGYYGQVQARGETALVARAQTFLSSLKPGKVIDGQTMERALLILDDQPGIRVTPVIRPGQIVGAGDLDVNISLAKRVGGSISLDNSGNRYTGKWQSRSELYIDSPFVLGDQITLSATYSEENLWNGGVGYSLPLGSKGLRGNIGYAHTFYELGKEFASLDANGTADIGSAGISYSLIRSQQLNVTLLASYQKKRLKDQQDSVQISDTKHSNSLPLGLNFDFRDTLGGGGITYGSLSWTYGKMDLDDSLRTADLITANTQGEYNKINLDVARLQFLPAQIVGFVRFSSQFAFDNLDSSEGFGLGGVSGVRAYPIGEGYGDEGWLTQIEIRREHFLPGGATLIPFAFYDIGRVRINHSPWDDGDNHRRIAGSGIGLRASYGRLSADATAAWRTSGGKPRSDSKDDNSVIWASIKVDF